MILIILIKNREFSIKKYKNYWFETKMLKKKYEDQKFKGLKDTEKLLKTLVNYIIPLKS